MDGFKKQVATAPTTNGGLLTKSRRTHSRLSAQTASDLGSSYTYLVLQQPRLELLPWKEGSSKYQSDCWTLFGLVKHPPSLPLFHMKERGQNIMRHRRPRKSSDRCLTMFELDNQGRTSHSGWYSPMRSNRHHRHDKKRRRENLV